MQMVYFAWVRERIGVSNELVAPPPDVATVADLVGWLAGRDEAHAAAFAEPDRLRAAVDQLFVGMDASVVGATEIAIFPPVTGG